jgi:hypothetical protein
MEARTDQGTKMAQTRMTEEEEKEQKSTGKTENWYEGSKTKHHC